MLREHKVIRVYKEFKDLVYKVETEVQQVKVLKVHMVRKVYRVLPEHKVLVFKVETGHQQVKVLKVHRAEMESKVL